MHLSKVSLVNYRNFEFAKFVFKPGVNTIIGENGSGKSNLFRAIRLLLDSNIYRAAHELSEGDFFRKKTSWKGHWIVISLEFDDISTDESIQSLFVHHGAIVSGSAVNKATYNLIFRPNSHIRTKLAALSAGDKAGLATLQESMTVDDYEVWFTGRSDVDFTAPARYREIVGDFDNVWFPALDSKLIGTKIPHQLSVAKEVSFTFVKALRDVVSDFNGNRQNPLLNLLTRKSQEIDKSKYETITNTVKSLNLDIEALQDVQDVRGDIRTTISETAGDAYAPASLHIRSDLPSEAEKLLQSLKLFVGEADENYAGDISELSLGGANLIYLTLKLLEFKYQKQRETAANFLLVEEPEAHIHTHIQKTLFDNINYSNTQIIYSTHSTQISEVSNIESVNVLARKGVRCESYQPSVSLTRPEIVHLQRYLDATRSSLLFARGVILIEGDAEEFMIPALVKKVIGVSLDELGISLINIRSTGFENIACVFHPSRIRRKCSIVTDLDMAITGTDILETDSDTVRAYKSKVAGSAESGRTRRTRLENFCRDNPFVNTYYAQHTFEVDLLMADNTHEIKRVVDSIYTDVPTRRTAKAELEDADIGVAGKRILTMANYLGKGWFAILLADNISRATNIPEYILESVLGACEELPCKTKLKILRHRIVTLTTEDYYEEFYNDALLAQDLLVNYENGNLSFSTLTDSLGDLLCEDSVLATFLGI
ncbi:AAA family ATPase [Pseudomonas syringae]|uniref:AAA family ATPase n=1 Tax=Pseudomonas syringae TaxID=317 RepID=UPI0005164940|nr:AAA family ATPase [Pseudomonas syringae]